MATTKAEIGTFKGHSTITLVNDDHPRSGFSFGITKARMILDCLADIKKFVEANSPLAGLDDVQP
jgi:hypothetical protein